VFAIAAQTRHDGGNVNARYRRAAPACARPASTALPAIGLSLSLLVAAPAHAQLLEIHHINVGQGDATLILGPVAADGSRVTVLIDAGDIPSGGDRDGGAIVLAVLRERGVTRIDFFVATHYDADHIGGIVTGASQTHGTSFVLGPDGVPGAAGDDDGDGVADWLDATQTQPDPEELGRGDDIAIAHFVDRGDFANPGTGTALKYRAMATSMGDRFMAVDQAAVDTFDIDLGGGARMDLLAANGFVRNRANRVANVNTENERSLAFLLSFSGFHYLIGGDLIGREAGAEDARVERAVADFLQAQAVDVDVLHANHHGANNASASEFLSIVRPETVIISAGNDNPHLHPNASALGRLVTAGVALIYQTNWGSTSGTTPATVRRRQAIFQGDVLLTTDGLTYEVSTRRRFPVDRQIP
jgi:beta-lactamase superfamily II metal-dependent hydrolase